MTTYFLSHNCVDEDYTKKDGLSQVHGCATTYELVPLPARKKYSKKLCLHPDLKNKFIQKVG